MPADDDNPAARVAAARDEAREARVAEAKASKALLEKMLRQPIEKRFAAFEGEARSLTASDRRELLKSIKDQVPGGRATIGRTTASRYAIWRSGLRYRVASIATGALLVVFGGVGWLVASVQTPSHAVEIIYAEPIAADFRSPSGVIYANSLNAKQRYAVVGQASGHTQLRLWVPRQGYAIASVPSEWLRRAP